MPTGTFERLPQSKKQQIRDAIIQECSQVPYEQVSINRIVRSAGISRGSFYQYFADKRDMFLYVTRDVKERVLAVIKEGLKQNVSFLDLMMRIYDVLQEECSQTPYLDMYRNMVKNWQIQQDWTAFPLHCRQPLEQLYERMNIGTSLTKQQFLCWQRTVFILVKASVVELFLDPHDLTKKREQFRQQMQLMNGCISEQRR